MLLLRVLVDLLGASECVDHLMERFSRGVVAFCEAGFLEDPKLLLDDFSREGFVAFDEDQVVLSLIELFRLDQKLFVEFFARTQPRFDNLDPRRAREAN